MKTMSQVHGGTSSQKKLILFGLYLLAAAIALLGVFFCIYSYLHSISFQVLNVHVPGMIFGLVVIYFGVRSILSVHTLKSQLYKDDAKFSWSNFKWQKKAKNR